jgi:hypothetical protein
MTRMLFSLLFLGGCTVGRHVDEDGTYPPLFPQTPLSESPCLEDQDCVVTHLNDGQCCPNPITEASNLVARDQFDKLVNHQNVVCHDEKEPYACPVDPAPGHIEFVYQGACVEQRCVRRKVPSDAPHTPTLPPPQAGHTEPPSPVDTTPEASATQTAASPKAD